MGASSERAGNRRRRVRPSTSYFTFRCSPRRCSTNYTTRPWKCGFTSAPFAALATPWEARVSRLESAEELEAASVLDRGCDACGVGDEVGDAGVGKASDALGDVAFVADDGDVCG